MLTKVTQLGKNRIKLEVEIELDSTSMLNSEEQILAALNELGGEATQVALSQFDTDGRPIEINGEKLTSKGSKKKVSKPLQGNRMLSACLSKK